MDAEHLSLLPYDVLHRICFFLNTVDILKVSQILPDFVNILYSKSIIQNVNFYNEYYINVKNMSTFLTDGIRCNMIVSLNLNCIYWIPAKDIRNCLGYLENLESLFVMDTKLGLLEPDLATYYSLPQLKKLAVSVKKRMSVQEPLNCFPKITHFYVHLDLTDFYLHLDSEGDSTITRIMHVLRKYNCVKEFWLIESATLSFIPLTLLPRIVIPSSVIKFNSLLHNMNFCNEEVTHMRRMYGSTFTRMAMCWERRDRPVKSFENIDLGKEWNTFFNLCKNNTPFTPADSKKIIESESLDGIVFKEIHFAHHNTTCGDTHKDVVEKLVLGDDMKLLKKLAISFCVCIGEGDPTSVDTTLCLLGKIADNSPLIEELEIWNCVRVNGCRRVSNDTCAQIAKFKHLRRLTLDDVPIHINGAFLIDVFASCTFLNSLRIKSKQHNIPLHNFLCVSIKKHALSLKHLRYENPCGIFIDRLLLAMSENKNLSIERIYIKCKSVELMNSKAMHTFIKASRNLRFLYLTISEFPKVHCKVIMDSLKKFINPQKVYLITSNEFSATGRIQIPFIHSYEMMMCLTHVCGLDIFNGYV